MKGVISTGSKKSLLLQEKSLNSAENKHTEVMTFYGGVAVSLLWSVYLA
jgi:hypothetical protein